MRRSRVSRLISEVDVSAAFLRATARFLRGEGAPPAVRRRGPGNPRRMIERALYALPGASAKVIGSVLGVLEGVAPRSLRRVRAEDFARWTVGLYPRRQYPAVAIGSASGALAHLCAALEIPWLPQTLMLPVTTGIPPEDPQRALEFGRRYGPSLLEHNPEWRLHQVHDPSQTERTLAHVASFHLKRTRLGAAYEAFLREVLPPGGTIFVTECRRAWPVTRVGERHLFQLGALGEQLQGDPDDEGAEQTNLLGKWVTDEPAVLAPEAEWGFEPSLHADLDAFAREHGFRVARILFDEPDDLSPLVADLHGQWYREEGLSASTLAVESFVKVHPRQILRAGAVPFWMKFSCEDDAERLEEFLEARPPWEKIALLLFGRRNLDSCQAPNARWRELLAEYGHHGELLRESRALEGLEPAARIPSRMTLELLERFLDLHGAAYPVKFVQVAQAAARPALAPQESVAAP